MMTRRVLLGSYSSLTYDTQFTPPGPNSPPKLESAGTVNIGPRASWLLQHPIHRDIWYAAIEDDDEGGKKVGVRGKIEAYRLGGSDGREVEVLCSVSAGDNPCHIAIVQGGKALAATNYSGGSALLIPLHDDGTFSSSSTAPPNFIKYPSDTGRWSRAHQCVDRRDSNECWVVDLGNDCIWRMAITNEPGQPVYWNIAGRVNVITGGEPRQIVMSQDGKNLYTLNERMCTVSHHDLTHYYDEALAQPRLVSVQNILPSPHKFDPDNIPKPKYTSAAELTYHAPSRTLSASSRLIQGEAVDSMTFFKINHDGTLSAPEVIRPSRGKEYRGVGLVDDCLLVAGQVDGWVTCLQWDEQTGKWAEREFAKPVKFDGVVDIKPVL